MTKQRHRRARGARVISTVSVALVLTLLGIAALTGIVAQRVSDTFRSGIGMVVIVDETASAGAADTLSKELKKAQWVKASTFSSAEEVNKRWQEELGDVEISELHPFQPEYVVSVMPRWSSADSLESIASRLSELPAVYEVKVHKDMAVSVNRTLNSAVMAVLIVCAVLLVISFVLISNTVGMELYSDRMVVHTMQYVGARPGFIRRPFVGRSLVNGVLAGVISSAVLGGVVAWLLRVYPALRLSLTWIDATVVFVGLTALGAMVCGAAAWIATTRYIYGNIDDVLEA